MTNPMSADRQPSFEFCTAGRTFFASAGITAPHAPQSAVSASGSRLRRGRRRGLVAVLSPSSTVSGNSESSSKAKSALASLISFP